MRQRIVDVAHELFARRGIDGVSIADVAVTAGVSKANVMHHFGSKDGLYAACLDGIDGRLHAVVDRAMSDAEPAARLPDELAAWAAERPDDLRVMAYGLLRLPERDGRWALSEPVERMVDLADSVAGSRGDALEDVVDLLGVLTYREMARPLVEARSVGTSELAR